ncbi:testis-expressed protein 2 isoform X2 [Lepeophtheirus salmonis]|uniref:testis-expressed protein 2 isoform X2 n=1 Tax=Lepeophtheirus salmonis TaxID=72036 RepID=UPI001AE41448|nr:testis-expressed protein 2-like isoform X2 [Lepeophtheirus salmonis]XP_040571289.1 testis-expressed protein 2-like isoform X2 [Lepeophtheirus salmonis]
MSSFTETWGRKLKEFQNEDPLPIPNENESKSIEITPLSLSSSQQEITPPSSSSSSLAGSPSFLNTFKKNIRDKFKTEKVKWQQKQNTVSSLNSSSSLDLSSTDDIANENLCFTKNSISSESVVDSKLSHSLSEQLLSTVPLIVHENMDGIYPKKESISSIKDNNDFNHGSDDNEESCDLKTPKDSIQSEETPQKDTIRRSKFNFSFRSSPLKSQPKESENGEDSPAPTHRSTAIFQKIIGMSSQKNSNSPVSMRQLTEPSDLDNMDDDEKFTELIPGDEDTIERGIEADELLNIANYPPNFTRLNLPIIPSKPQNLTLHASNPNLSRSFLSKFQLYSLLPIVIVLLVQILPVPNWVTGFITGILISVPTAFYVSIKLFQDGETIVSPSDPKEFIVSVKSISPRLSSPIFIDEEIKRKSVWMNIWPSKYGVYDPMTYDVRWTVSVLVELYGYLVELRFPRKNIHLRRMHNEAEPEVENMNFFEHQVIDLTTAEICLMPDNLPAKWMWSKKYPIQIKTYSKKHGSSEGESNSSKGEENKQQNKSNGSDSDKSSSNPENEEEGEKSGEENNTDIRTYYLFARTGREKEEWYSRFRAAANFMKDWHHENPTPNTHVDKNYATFKQMEHKFKNFMDDYHQAKNAEEARDKMLDESSENEEENDEKKLNKQNIVKEQLAFINIFGARMWFDLHQSQVFIDFLRQKITRKLLKIKIAQYFDEVSVTTLDLGLKLPQIINASLPWQNEFGLWVDLDLEYHGVCEATVETKGIRLPTKDESEKEPNESRHQGSLIDSDEADSAEEDDDIPDNFNNDLEGADIFMDEKGGINSGTVYPGRDGLRSRMLESILKSSVVARMAETDWVKKNITGKNITLKLQLHSLKGILILNFPPPPSDRIWYGFRSPPKLDITLKPYFGGKNLSKLEGTFSTIMRLLEKRLKQEFMKVLVYPNMDDEVLSFMDHVPYYINR